MDNSIYITLSRQAALFRDMEVASNNIANVNTPGYQSQKLVFSDYLVSDNERKNAYANDPSTYRDTTTGTIKATGNPLDLAISGPGYFQVDTPGGRRYTKAGNFQVNADGTLVTVSGYPVLGADGGQIAIPETARDIAINGIGQVTVDGEEVGQVGVMEFKNEQAMKRVGNSLLSATEAPIPAELSRIAQGAIESSNVSPVTEMVHVMDVSRSVGSTAKFIETMYDLIRKTANTYTHSSQA